MINIKKIFIKLFKLIKIKMRMRIKINKINKKKIL